MVIIYCKLPLHKADFFKIYPNALAKGKHPRRCVLRRSQCRRTCPLRFPLGFLHSYARYLHGRGWRDVQELDRAAVPGNGVAGAGLS